MSDWLRTEANFDGDMPFPPGGSRWVITGVDLTEEWAPRMWADGQRVMVIASSAMLPAGTLTTRHRIRRGWQTGQIGDPLPTEGRTFHLSVGMDRLTIGYGATFREALARVLAVWDPETGQHELPAGPAALETGGGR